MLDLLSRYHLGLHVVAPAQVSMRVASRACFRSLRSGLAVLSVSPTLCTSGWMLHGRESNPVAPCGVITMSCARTLLRRGCHDLRGLLGAGATPRWSILASLAPFGHPASFSLIRLSVLRFLSDWF